MGHSEVTVNLRLTCTTLRGAFLSVSHKPLTVSINKTKQILPFFKVCSFSVVSVSSYASKNPESHPAFLSFCSHPPTNYDLRASPPQHLPPAPCCARNCLSPFPFLRCQSRADGAVMCSRNTSGGLAQIGMKEIFLQVVFTVCPPRILVAGRPVPLVIFFTLISPSAS